ncbi:toll/interleukin-1 receptor domain-containing protein [Bacillus cereus]|uniref:toll/interleukin-1 receptor domain-containing protein n=1 Tax=Bacillus cereus TaxID=1396 RepID=UPI00345BF1A0
MGKILLKEASEIALKSLDSPSNLGEILRYIKEHDLFSFNTKDERGILRTNLKKNEKISEHDGFYSLKNLSRAVTDQIDFEGEGKISKIFISHAHADQEYVKEIIDLLESLGLGEKQIFCTSCQPYGILPSQNFLLRIKEELNNNVLVLFVLSGNFYKSPVSMCEMGATWVNTKKHVPILIPPFTFEDMKGVIPHTQGIYINDEMSLDMFLEFILNELSIENNLSIGKWNRKKRDFINSINSLIISKSAIKEV